MLDASDRLADALHHIADALSGVRAEKPVDNPVDNPAEIQASEIDAQMPSECVETPEQPETPANEEEPKKRKPRSKKQASEPEQPKAEPEQPKDEPAPEPEPEPEQPKAEPEPEQPAEEPEPEEEPEEVSEPEPVQEPEAKEVKTTRKKIDLEEVAKRKLGTTVSVALNVLLAIGTPSLISVRSHSLFRSSKEILLNL